MGGNEGLLDAIRKGVPWWLIAILGLSVLLLGYSIYQLVSYGNGLSDDNINRPEIILSILLVIGVITLIIALAVTAAIFRSLNLSNEKQALGLPQGSIRAVIALCLILIFMMSSVLLYEEVARPDGMRPARLDNISQAQLDRIPVEEILSLQQVGTVGNETRFNVTRLVGKTEASQDLAQQIITTVSTLVVAVAGFYFGSKSVEEATRSARGVVTAASPPLIRRVDPPTLDGNRETDIPFKVIGKNLESIAKVTLARDAAKIDCKDVQANATVVYCTVSVPKDTTDKIYPTGPWSVIVTSADGAEDRIDDAFTMNVPK